MPKEMMGLPRTDLSRDADLQAIAAYLKAVPSLPDAVPKKAESDAQAPSQ